MTRSTWLHLSDWHQHGEDFNRKVVRDRLLDDLHNRHRIDPALAQIDFVVFSGDLAHAGLEKEYQAARTHFLDPILKAVGLGPERLFLVPGNHDLARAELSELPPSLQQPFTSETEVQERLTDKKKRDRALEPFRAYAEFVTAYTGQPSPAYASLQKWELHGRRVALLGLNSAWMCGRNKNARGEVDDDGQLVVGEPQIHDALAEMADAAVRIVVLHHPFEWLSKFDWQRIERRVREAAHFVLCGHSHVPSVQPSHGTDGSCVFLPAGAAYDRRAPEARYANAYNFVQLDFATGQGKAFLRRFSDTRTAWIEDIETCPGGVFSFPLPKELGPRLPMNGDGRTPLSPGSSTVGSLPLATDKDLQRQREAEARYRELLLETCDIVDLAGLPEQDRLLVQRRLELRRLYVPLRAYIEMPLGEEGSNDHWEAVEQRRHAAWHGRSAKEAERFAKRQRVSIGERLAEARRLVVLGDPGTGKTTLTRWLVTAYLLRLRHDPDWNKLNDISTLPDEDWLPIVVRCRDLEDAACLGGALDDVLRHTLRKAELSDEEGEALRALFRTRLKAGTALLILDGLDEIADPAARARFCQQIERIVVAYPDAPVLATSRVVGYREMGYRLGRGFEHLTLAELNRKEKDDFALLWCALTELPERRGKAAANLVNDIHSSDRIERLTGNPMLLTTLALVRRKVGRLPSRRADLYTEAVQVLLYWRSEVDEPMDWREAVPQLEYLAYAMCDRGVQRLAEDEVLELLERMRHEYPSVHAVRQRIPEEFLRRVEARTGLLVAAGHVRDRGRMVPIYEFRHLTFQEYLAARALVDGRFPGRDPARSLAEQVAPLAGQTEVIRTYEPGEWDAAVVESWREPLRLCASICRDEDVDSLLRAISTPRPGEQPETARARAILAARCLADEPNVTESVAQEVLSALAAEVQDPDGDGLGLTGVEVAAAELAPTRWGRVLRRCLVQEFERREPLAREAPGALVGELHATMFTQETDRYAWLLEQIKHLDSEVEAIALDALLGIVELAYEGKIVSVSELPARLLDSLAVSAPRSHAAAWALAWLHARNAWRPSASDVVRLMRFVAVTDADPLAVRWISRVLGREQVKEAVMPLLHWLAHPHALVRKSVAEALGAIGSEQAVEALMARLEDPAFLVRIESIGALAEIGAERSIGALLLRLKDPEAEIHVATLEALGRIGGEQATEALLSLLEDPNMTIRVAANRALGEIGGERAVAALLMRVADPETRIRVAVIQALGRIGGARAAEAFRRSLEDSDAEVRCEALRGLAKPLESTERLLLTIDLDGKRPYLDPRQTIAESRVQDAAAKLKCPSQMIRSRYEALAERFGLRLAFAHEAKA